MNDPVNDVVMSFASLGNYRLNTMSSLKNAYGDRLQIFSGDKAPDPSIKIIAWRDLDHTRLRNYILPGSVVLQRIPLLTYLRCNLLIIDLNPRMPLNWLLLITRKALGRRTLLWGHAFPRAGQDNPTEKLRAAMRKLASGLIAYTHSQAKELQNLHAGTPVWAAPNALYPKEQFGFDVNSARDSFLYVGRLHEDKKPLLMIDAFESLLQENVHTQNLRLVIVGSGPLEKQVVERARTSDFGANISVLGHIDNYDDLRELYSRAIASISPGYVGLSVTQTLSFGVPMIISRFEPHAPELEAVVEGQNGQFFETDHAGDLKNALLDVFVNREEWKRRGSEITAECAENYSVEAMVDGLMRAIENRVP